MTRDLAQPQRNAQQTSSTAAGKDATEADAETEV